MNAKELYTKQMNDFCEENCKLTATDILAQAGKCTNESGIQTPANTDKTSNHNIVSISGKRKALRFGNMAAACVICFLLAGTTILATTGHLGNILKNIMNDTKTMEIAEKGYVYEVQRTLADETFSATLVGFTGDRTNPKVVFDLAINDPQLVATTESISINVYTLGVQQFENELDNYGYCEAYGVKDDQVENLYHFSVDGASVWLTRGEEAVIHLFQVTTFGRSGQPQVYDVDFEYRITIPEESFHPVPYIAYTGKGFIYDNVTYSLNAVQYGYYYTQISFYSDDIVQEAPTNASAISAAEFRMQQNWEKVVPTATLIVDGTEYELLSEDGYSTVWLDSQADTDTPYRSYMHLFFPDIKYGSAHDITLKIGGTKITLK